MSALLKYVLTFPLPNVLKASSRITMSLSSGVEGSLEATERKPYTIKN